ncbi:hypothetical protein P175DRAFT_0494640 [Aspergillus ochraceoroseus IBT 24754]|uniref:Uncharacterized protein n=1 Tax=Aspergillus ochraceoroseus IBT 24754 TaxID=1392256 RepID=A0A2T5LTA6_9EURO|nr:uncharacterized protein P175DRAFT_0494640 [Aspergillus ochraceoroseus IBT 24754]PTU19516.1 hypothetical protein P175DRAFT_0494640 [Aspergillus ochraceoroseus IBT 24754]
MLSKIYGCDSSSYQTLCAYLQATEEAREKYEKVPAEEELDPATINAGFEASDQAIDEAKRIITNQKNIDSLLQEFADAIPDAHQEKLQKEMTVIVDRVYSKALVDQSAAEAQKKKKKKKKSSNPERCTLTQAFHRFSSGMHALQNSLALFIMQHLYLETRVLCFWGLLDATSLPSSEPAPARSANVLGIEQQDYSARLTIDPTESLFRYWSGQHALPGIVMDADGAGRKPFSYDANLMGELKVHINPQAVLSKHSIQQDYTSSHVETDMNALLGPARDITSL